MFRFSAGTEGLNRIGLREKLQAFSNDYWVLRTRATARPLRSS